MSRQIAFSIVLAIVLCSAASAMILEPGSVTLVTTDANSSPYGWGNLFAICRPSELLVWIDDRDFATYNAPAVYGVRLDMPPYTEFLIDQQASDASQVVADGNILAYPTWLPSYGLAVKVANIADVNNPVFRTVQLQYPQTMGVSGSLVACSVADPATWVISLHVLDVSDMDNIVDHTVVTMSPDESLGAIAINDSLLIWSVDNYGAGMHSIYVADITEPNNPIVDRTDLPEGSYIGGLEVSGNWLLASGNYAGKSQYLVVHDFADSNDWQFQTIWKEGYDDEQSVSYPRIDGQIAAWVVSTSMPAAKHTSSSEPEWKIKAAYLNPLGEPAISTLRSTSSQINDVQIINNTIVWSEYESEMDLYKGTIALECGDYGYAAGDLNRDCYVDFKDFATFLADWLKCTAPDAPGCGFGTNQ